MRVALVNKEFDARRGGGEVYACHLAQGLIERGHQVTLVAQAVDLPGPAPHEFLRVTPRATRRGSRVVEFNRAVDQVLDRSRYDVVHGLTQIFPQDVHRAGGGVFRHWEMLSQPNPLVRAVVRLGWRNRMQRWVEDQIYRPGNYRVIMTNSRLVAGNVRQFYGVPAERIEVVPNGVDLERFHPRLREAGTAVRRELGLGDRDPVLLFVGNNIRRKGLGRLGRAMAHLPGAAHVRILVVGRTARWQVRWALRAHPGDWTWVGPQEDVARYYAAADLLVLPTLYDPFANVSLEALASGLPVVTTRTNGACELLTPGEDGEVVEDPSDAPRLARAIESLLERRGDALRERARRKAEAYPWSRNVDEVERIYRGVLAEKAAPAGAAVP